MSSLIQREAFGVLPEQDQRFRQAFLLWCEYYVATEAFDRTLPGGWSPYDRDSWMPAPSSRKASARYASECIRVVDAHAVELGIPIETLIEARKAAAELSVKDQQVEISLANKQTE